MLVLRLLSYCCKIKENRKKLWELDATRPLVSIISFFLFLFISEEKKTFI